MENSRFDELAKLLVDTGGTRRGVLRGLMVGLTGATAGLMGSAAHARKKKRKKKGGNPGGKPGRERNIGESCAPGDTCRQGSCVEYAPGVALFRNQPPGRYCLLADGATGCFDPEECQGGLCVDDVCGTLFFNQTCSAATDSCASIDQYRKTSPGQGLCACVVDIEGNPASVTLEFVFSIGGGSFGIIPCASNAACGAGKTCVVVKEEGFWCDPGQDGGFCSRNCGV